MVLLRSRYQTHKVPESGEILKIIREGRDKWQQKLAEILPGLGMEERWDIIKTAWPDLDKNRCRDLARLFWADEFAALKAKLENVEERYLAIECLSYLPSRETVELLVELLQNKDEMSSFVPRAP